MNRIDRRDFLKSCCVAAVAGGVGSRAKAYFAPPPLIPATATEDTLVIVFLRGAMDGLSLLPPGGSSPFRADYEANRTNTRVPTSGTGAALPLANTTFALHPRATALQALYQANHLAFVVAAGQMQPNPVVRSHFEAQSNLEFGFGGGAGTSTGWLTRHLLSGGLPQTVPLPATSMGNITASSLLGSTDAITMASGSDFRLDTFHWSWQNDDAAHGLVGAVTRMNDLWTGSTMLEVAGADTLGSLAMLRPIDFNPYDPNNHPNGYQPSGGANYSLNYNGGFGSQLRNVAQLIKLNLGLRAVTIDLGNWDTHNGQGNPTQSYDWFGNQVESLSQGLAAFYTDLSSDASGNFMQHVSVIVVSEFGRRVLENADSGTDHGYGNVMLALGGAVNGGTVYGNLPGLDNQTLYQGTDVAVTTDYRQLISEALIRRMANPNIYYVFPGYAGYAPLGVFQG
ncbi:MAG TPA: DUF1501 domain-containing protein, partial [Rhodanobacteraceae bacterium]|nr:DUF1501 domain-containing protein [Rhodanobacteraceae bacterium]